MDHTFHYFDYTVIFLVFIDVFIYTFINVMEPFIVKYFFPVLAVKLNLESDEKFSIIDNIFDCNHHLIVLDLIMTNFLVYAIYVVVLPNFLIISKMDKKIFFFINFPTTISVYFRSFPTIFNY